MMHGRKKHQITNYMFSQASWL